MHLSMGKWIKKNNFIIKQLIAITMCIFIYLILKYNNFMINSSLLNKLTVPIILEIAIIFNIISLYVTLYYNNKNINIKCKIKTNRVYMAIILILLSLLMILIEVLFGIDKFLIENNYIEIFMVLINIIYSCFLIYESKIKINDELKYIQDYDVLYDVLDNEIEEQEIYIFTKNNKLIYANRLARIRHKVQGNDIAINNKIESIYKYFIEYFPQDIYMDMKKSIKEKGNWSGVILDNLDEEVFLKIAERKSKKYGTVEIIQVIYNKGIIKLKKMVDEKNRIFDIITEKAEDLIIILDNNKIITYVNDEASNILGYKKEELIGCSLDEFTIYDKSMNITNINKFEQLSIIKKDGSIVETETMSSPINKNKDEGWILISRNITYIKELELIKEKYDEIKFHEQLKTDFFANLSHELKTPLNIFYSIIQLLDSKVEYDEKDFREFYKKYNRGLRINFYRMFRMITNLIDLTKLDANFENVEFKNIDIVQLCEDITLSVITYAQQKNIQITFDTEIEESIIKCNGEYMERIMLNLLSNAIKFTPRNGEILVKLSFDKEYVYIKVKDNGIGIPKEKQEFIFEKFARIDKTLSRNNEGSGIGLSIVKSLLDLQDGTIILKSEENKGSEFIVKLPNIKLDEKHMIDEIKSYEVDSQKITLELSDIYDIL